MNAYSQVPGKHVSVYVFSFNTERDQREINTKREWHKNTEREWHKLMRLRHDTVNLRADLGSDCLINGFRHLRRLREQRIDFSDLLLAEIAILDCLGVDEHVQRRAA